MVDTYSSSAETSQQKGTNASDWDQVMLAMDVVDTLRHRKFALDEILARNDETLINKVRHIYRDQGINVSDTTIREAVEALNEERFSYNPPTNGWRLRLAHAYIDRVKWAKRVAVIAIIGGVVYAVYAVRESYRERKIQTQIEAQQADEKAFAELVESSANLILNARDTAKTPDAQRGVESAVNALMLAIDQDDSIAAKDAATELRSLTTEIALAYEVRIVSRPGKKSGVFRIPEENPGTRNYYVIVEAIDHSSRPVAVSITSEEDGSTDTVNTWGMRVAFPVFEKVKQDKLDDGIIQNSRFGSKRTGALKPDYNFTIDGGAITRW